MCGSCSLPAEDLRFEEGCLWLISRSRCCSLSSSSVCSSAIFAFFSGWTHSWQGWSVVRVGGMAEICKEDIFKGNTSKYSKRNKVRLVIHSWDCSPHCYIVGLNAICDWSTSATIQKLCAANWWHLAQMNVPSEMIEYKWVHAARSLYISELHLLRSKF